MYYKYKLNMTYKEFLEITIKECKTKADFCRALDKKPTGGNYRTIDNIIKEYNLDISHFKSEPWNKNIRYKNPIKSLDEILVENSSHLNTNSLKLRLIKNGLKEYKCELCGNKEIVELHHINGNPTDNRIENLQLLCPNCHSKTNNYRGKKKLSTRIHKLPSERILSDEEIRIRDESRKLAKRKNISINNAEQLILNTPNLSINDIPINVVKLKDKICPICGKLFHPKSKETIFCSMECNLQDKSKNIPTKEELLDKLKELKCNMIQVGKFFNVSDNAVRKWCIKYNMPKHKKELLNYINNL